MKRNSKQRELIIELIVGIFMFMILVGMIFFTILISRENIFRKAYFLEVVFDDVVGLSEGDDVVIRGLPVGTVKKFALKNDGVHVIAALRQPLRLREDYKIEIIPTSVFGGCCLQVNSGSATKPELSEDTIAIGEPPNAWIADASSIVADFKTITEKIKSGEGTLGKLVNDDALYNDMQDVVGQIKTALDEDGMLKNLKNSVANLNEITEKIKTGEGTLGKLINDENLYNSTTAAITEAQNALDDIRETSPLVLFTSILFGAF